jgi:hypothetical protein
VMVPHTETVGAANRECEWRTTWYLTPKRWGLPGGTPHRNGGGTPHRNGGTKKTNTRSYPVTYLRFASVRNGRNHSGTLLTHSPKQLNHVGNQQTAHAKFESGQR